MGHTSAGRGNQQHGSGRDVCHVSGYSSQPRLPGAASHSRYEAKTDIPRASGSHPHRL